MRWSIAWMAVLVALMAAAPAQARERTYRYLSPTLDAAGYQVLFGRSVAPRPPGAGFVTSMRVRIVDTKGRYVPPWRVMLHHIVYSNTVNRDPVCPRLVGERFYGTGEEDRPLELPHGYGYRVRRKDHWRESWMIMSHHAQPDRVRIETRVTFDDRRNLEPVRPYWVGVTRCMADPIFNVPGGAAGDFAQKRDWVVPRDGRLVAAESHMHGGARELSLTQPACQNRTLFASRPGYGLPSHSLYKVHPLVHEPGPLTTSSQRTARGIPVRKGTRLTVHADYDGGRLHTRVMGIMHVYLARAHGHRRPPPCAALPGDVVTTTANRLVGPGVTTPPEPPHLDVPLARLGPDGLAHEVDRVAGDPVQPGADPFHVANFAVTPPSVVVAPGALLTWQ